MQRLRLILASAAAGLFGLLFTFDAALAQRQIQPSECLAMAQSLPRVRYASLDRLEHALPALPVAAKRGEVTITYAGHSTYVIETPDGVVAATDFSGYYTTEKLPTVVTMNRAHSSHYTLRPDPRIAHVLHGWGEGGKPAEHYQMIGDVLVRNVTTDIRDFFGDTNALHKDGNSIFIFEVAGLCIGHLGHLHHPLDDTHVAAIGRLDVVMVPIDGGLTMSIEGMSGITQRLRSSVVLPMHRNGTPLNYFLGRMQSQFEIDLRSGRSFTVSRETLPKKPTIVVLDGV